MQRVIVKVNNQPSRMQFDPDAIRMHFGHDRAHLISTAPCRLGRGWTSRLLVALLVTASRLIHGKAFYSHVGIVHCWLRSSQATGEQYITKLPVSSYRLNHIYPSIQPSSLFLTRCSLPINIPLLSHTHTHIAFPFYFLPSSSSSHSLS